MAFGDPEIGGYPFHGTVEEGLDITGRRLPFDYYRRAGHFTRFMIESWGVDGFLRARDLTSVASDYDAVDRAFVSALGVGLDEELERYEHFPVLCIQAGYRFPLLECTLEPSPWLDDDTFVVDVDLACESSDVLGPFYGEIFTLRAFEIDELSHYQVELHTPAAETARAWIVKCDSECADVPREHRQYPFEPPQKAFELRARQATDELLHPGKYWIRLARPLESPGPMTLILTRTDP